MDRYLNKWIYNYLNNDRIIKYREIDFSWCDLELTFSIFITWYLNGYMTCHNRHIYNCYSNVAMVTGTMVNVAMITYRS